MRNALLVVAAIALAGSGCASAGTGVDAAGVLLPAHVGPYVVARVVYGGDPMQGAFVSYLPGDPTSALPRIDVIVYPAHGVRLGSEIAYSYDDLLETDRTSAQIDGTTLLGEGRFAVEESADTAYRAAYFVRVRDVPQRSLVYLHATGGRFVKARTSFALHPGYDPDDRIDDAVIELFEAATEDGRH